MGLNVRNQELRSVFPCHGSSSRVSFSWQCIVPLVLGISDYQQRRRRENDLPQLTNHTIFNRVKQHVLYGRLRYVYISLLYSWGSYVAVSVLSRLDTTYICPTSLPHGSLVPLYQWIGALIDCFLLESAERLLRPDSDNRPRKGFKGPTAWSWVLLVSWCFWSMLSPAQ